MSYIKQPSFGSYSELSSRFEAALIPLSSPEGLRSAQEEFKMRFPKADHYPYAYRYEGLSRSSDDGEPSGTGGRALLGLLEQKQLDCCLLIVARYFGGTKLGVPRLRRAFLSSGEDAIKHASLYIRKPCYEYRIECSYAQYAVLEKYAERFHFQLKNTLFDVNVLTNLRSFDIMDASWEKMGLPISLLPSPEIKDEYVEVEP